MPSTTGIRCGRCDKGFPSHRAKQQHVQDSGSHHLCGYCTSPTGYETEEDLDNHLEKVHHICTACDYRRFADAHRLALHDMDKHNIRIVCRRRFQTMQNLKMHKLIHAERAIECAGCSRMFVTESAMLLHLETGTCASGADSYFVSNVGRQCYRAFYYVSYTSGYPFQCPTCETPFSLLSGLVQHVESDHCDDA
ncbi:unnamed protein product [Fusarium fujikuroi]|uniref:C2H2-type domain-containing protein n=1 Tax=Fusarium fujikuroi TaxID=5127 RepID=A0A9Q9RNY5_FUSFU|nr:unnamed protein product [Fusarium fujikuroi]VTT68170.1 unnamed protein product [Fusarium fujikuroi]VZI08138.1 unnamed protein product [Fusarium fujikuroi]